MGREPLSNDDAKRLAASVVRAGGVVDIVRHARQAMLADGLAAVDVHRALLSGFVEFSEQHESGQWRYRFRSGQVFVVVAFRSEQVLVVVTVWRKK